MKTPKTFGQRVTTAREEMGLGVNEFTKLVRLPTGEPPSGGYISRIENDERDDIPATYALAIAHALGVRVEWLVEGKGPKRFASGEMPVTFEAAKSDKANLERVLDATRSRWLPATIAVARSMSADLPVHEWPAKLDSLEDEIRPVLEKHDRPPVP